MGGGGAGGEGKCSSDPYTDYFRFWYSYNSFSDYLSYYSRRRCLQMQYQVQLRQVLQALIQYFQLSHQQVVEVVVMVLHNSGNSCALVVQAVVVLQPLVGGAGNTPTVSPSKVNQVELEQIIRIQVLEAAVQQVVEEMQLLLHLQEQTMVVTAVQVQQLILQDPVTYAGGGGGAGFQETGTGVITPGAGGSGGGGRGGGPPSNTRDTTCGEAGTVQAEAVVALEELVRLVVAAVVLAVCCNHKIQISKLVFSQTKNYK